MVDGLLPLTQKPRRLRFLFLDLNAYFASVEQQERPELRGRPVAVVPVTADTSFVIAASYEAKAFGVKCGTMIRDAKQMCPGIEIIKSRSQIYVDYHRRIIETAESVLPVDQVCSIDEMRFRLLETESDPATAVQLAHKMKAALTQQMGEHIKASIGIAPNAFLAKVATDMQKPDGLVVLRDVDLPHKLHGLKLTDFAGINRRMAARLNAAGIFTAQDLCKADPREMRQAFGSVVGERWWYLLRGFDLDQELHDRKSLGHSHVLPPELRNEKGCREVLLRLLGKAAARLRSTNLWTKSMSVYVRGFKKSWQAHTSLPPTQDSVTLTEAFARLWEEHDFDLPRGVGVTFYDLCERDEFTPSLFDATEDRSKLSHAIDQVNQRFGKHSVYLAGIEKVRQTADEKIAFNKTWLFSEGRGDNEFVDTFRGLRDTPH